MILKRNTAKEMSAMKNMKSFTPRKIKMMSAMLAVAAATTTGALWASYDEPAASGSEGISNSSQKDSFVFSTSERTVLGDLPQWAPLSTFSSSNGNFQASLSYIDANGNSTDENNCTWDSDVSGTKTLSMEISYSDLTCTNGYRASGIEMSIPAPAGELRATDISANIAGLGSWAFDAELITDGVDQPMLYLYNADDIAANTPFQGTIRIDWKINNRGRAPEYHLDMPLKVKASDRSGNVSEYTAENILSLDIKTYHDEFIPSITSGRISSLAGLDATWRKYIWVEYSVNAGTIVKTMPLSSGQYKFSLPDDVIVNGNIGTKQDDGAYLYDLRNPSYPESVTFTVGWPKDIYDGKQIAWNFEILGEYLDGAPAYGQADSSLTNVILNASDYEFQYTGEIYRVDIAGGKDTSWTLLKEDKAVEQTFNMSFRSQMCPDETRTYTLMNDWQDITTNANGFRSLTNSEFYITSVMGPTGIFGESRNPRTDAEWLQARVVATTSTGEEILVGSLAMNDELPMPSDTVDVRIEYANVNGYIEVSGIRVKVAYCVDGFDTDQTGTPDLLPLNGKVRSVTGLLATSQGEVMNKVDADSYIGNQGEQIAARDKERYGYYVQRDYAEFEYTDYVEPGYEFNQRLSAFSDEAAASGEKGFTQKIRLRYQLDLRRTGTGTLADLPILKHFSFYVLLPKGWNANSTLLGQASGGNGQGPSFTRHVVSENWQGTGQWMVKFDYAEANLPIQVGRASYNYEMIFSMFLPADAYYEYGSRHDVTAYAFVDEFSSSKIEQVKVSGESYIDEEDIDSDGDTREIHALGGTNFSINSTLGDHMEVNEKVSSAASSWVWANKTDIAPGSEYRYKLSFTTGSELSNIVMYDSIEEDSPWKGSFSAVDVSYLIDKGYHPVVYGSTSASAPNNLTQSEWEPIENFNAERSPARIAIKLDGDSVPSGAYLKAVIKMIAPSGNDYLEAYGQDRYTLSYYTNFISRTLTSGYAKLRIVGEQGQLHIVKVDGETGELLNSAKFIVYNADGNVVLNRVNPGVYTLSEGTYTVVENSAPQGYIGDTTRYTVEIKAGETYEHRVANIKQKGAITITKRDAIGYAPLGDAHFSVTHNGEPFAELVTELDGKITLTDLDWGTYVFTETKAPAGYKAIAPLTFTIDASNAKGNTSPVTYYPSDERIFPVIKIEKTDATTGEPMPNIQFLISKPSGSGYLSVAKGTTNEQGVAVMQDNSGGYPIRKLTWGVEYRLEEVVPEGYTKMEPMMFTLTKEEAISGKTFKIENQRIDGTATIVKKDIDTGDFLSGATFELYSSNGKLVGVPVETNAFGEVLFTGLAWDTYTVKEVHAPHGYMRDIEEKSFVISPNNCTVTQRVIFEDKKYLGDLTIAKYDASTPVSLRETEGVWRGHKLLGGAEMELRNSTGEVIRSFTTDGSNPVVLEDLPFGSYQLFEVAAPSGYVSLTEPIAVDFTRDTQYVEVPNDKDVETFIIKATKNIPGAEFTLYRYEELPNTTSLSSIPYEMSQSKLMNQDFLIHKFKLWANDYALNMTGSLAKGDYETSVFSPSAAGIDRCSTAMYISGTSFGSSVGNPDNYAWYENYLLTMTDYANATPEEFSFTEYAPNQVNYIDYRSGLIRINVSDLAKDEVTGEYIAKNIYGQTWITNETLDIPIYGLETYLAKHPETQYILLGFPYYLRGTSYEGVVYEELVPPAHPLVDSTDPDDEHIKDGLYLVSVVGRSLWSNGKLTYAACFEAPASYLQYRFPSSVDINLKKEISIQLYDDIASRVYKSFPNQILSDGSTGLLALLAPTDVKKSTGEVLVHCTNKVISASNADENGLYPLVDKDTGGNIVVTDGKYLLVEIACDGNYYRDVKIDKGDVKTNYQQLIEKGGLQGPFASVDYNNELLFSTIFPGYSNSSAWYAVSVPFIAGSEENTSAGLDLGNIYNESKTYPLLITKYGFDGTANEVFNSYDVDQLNTSYNSSYQPVPLYKAVKLDANEFIWGLDRGCDGVIDKIIKPDEKLTPEDISRGFDVVELAAPNGWSNTDVIRDIGESDVKRAARAQWRIRTVYSNGSPYQDITDDKVTTSYNNRDLNIDLVFLDYAPRSEYNITSNHYNNIGGFDRYCDSLRYNGNDIANWREFIDVDEAIANNWTWGEALQHNWDVFWNKHSSSYDSGTIEMKFYDYKSTKKQLTLNKIDAADGSPLTGSEFYAYWTYPGQVRIDELIGKVENIGVNIYNMDFTDIKVPSSSASIKIVETKVPDGYATDNVEKIIAWKDLAVGNNIVEFKNYRIPNEDTIITWNKLDKTTMLPVNDVEFDVFKIKDKQETLVQTVKSGSEGTVILNLGNNVLFDVPGNYVVREKKVPGFEEKSRGYSFTIYESELGQTKQLSADMGDIILNERENKELNIKKIDADTKLPLSGGAFAIYSDAGELLYDDLTAVDGIMHIPSIPVNNFALGIGNSDSGHYVLIEKSAPDGYRTASGKQFQKIMIPSIPYAKGIVFDIDPDAPVTELTVDNATDRLPKLIMHKLDRVDGSPVQGAEFSISNISTGAIAATVTSDEDGNFPEVELPNDTYILTEISAPSGYRKTEPIEISIDDSDVEINIYDNRTTGSITVHKTDSKTGNVISDAEFSLYLISGEDKADRLVAKAKTDERGELVFSGLSWGVSYRIEETSPATGYSADNLFSQEIMLTTDNLNVSCPVKNTPLPGYAKYIKRDGEYENIPLQGVQVALYKENGELVAEDLQTDANGEVTYGPLDWGNYYFVETKSLDGYEIDPTPQELSITAKTAGEHSAVAVKHFNYPSADTGRDIVVNKQLACELKAEQEQTFIFKCEGTDSTARYGTITISNGEQSGSYTFTDLDEDVSYTIKELSNYRYEQCDIASVNGRIIDNGYVSFDQSVEEESVTFFNKTKTDEGFGDSHAIVNDIEHKAAAQAVKPRAFAGYYDSSEYANGQTSYTSNSLDPSKKQYFKVKMYFSNGDSIDLPYNNDTVTGPDGNLYYIASYSGDFTSLPKYVDTLGNVSITVTGKEKDTQKVVCQRTLSVQVPIYVIGRIPSSSYTLAGISDDIAEKGKDSTYWNEYYYYVTHPEDPNSQFSIASYATWRELKIRPVGLCQDVRSDGKGKVGITFQFVNAPSSNFQMPSAFYNNAALFSMNGELYTHLSSGDFHLYLAAVRVRTLNSTGTTYYNDLPMWLPSKSQLIGSGNASYEGEQYEAYKHMTGVSASSIGANNTAQASVPEMLRSTGASTTTNTYINDSTGNLYSGNYNTVSAVRPCFALSRNTGFTDWTANVLFIDATSNTEYSETLYGRDAGAISLAKIRAANPDLFSRYSGYTAINSYASRDSNGALMSSWNVANYSGTISETNRYFDVIYAKGLNSDYSTYGYRPTSTIPSCDMLAPYAISTNGFERIDKDERGYSLYLDMYYQRINAGSSAISSRNYARFEVQTTGSCRKTLSYLAHGQTAGFKVEIRRWNGSSWVLQSTQPISIQIYDSQTSSSISFSQAGHYRIDIIETTTNASDYVRFYPMRSY